MLAPSHRTMIHLSIQCIFWFLIQVLLYCPVLPLPFLLLRTIERCHHVLDIPSNTSYWTATHAHHELGLTHLEYSKRHALCLEASFHRLIICAHSDHWMSSFQDHSFPVAQWIRKSPGHDPWALIPWQPRVRQSFTPVLFTHNMDKGSSWSLRPQIHSPHTGQSCHWSKYFHSSFLFFLCDSVMGLGSFRDWPVWPLINFNKKDAFFFKYLHQVYTQDSSHFS